jgi:hypothetical protein
MPGGSDPPRPIHYLGRNRLTPGDPFDVNHDDRINVMDLEAVRASYGLGLDLNVAGVDTIGPGLQSAKRVVPVARGVLAVQ